MDGPDTIVIHVHCLLGNVVVGGGVSKVHRWLGEHGDAAWTAAFCRKEEDVLEWWNYRRPTDNRYRYNLSLPPPPPPSPEHLCIHSTTQLTVILSYPYLTLFQWSHLLKWPSSSSLNLEVMSYFSWVNAFVKILSRIILENSEPEGDDVTTLLSKSACRTPMLSVHSIHWN